MGMLGLRRIDRFCTCKRAEGGIGHETGLHWDGWSSTLLSSYAARRVGIVSVQFASLLVGRVAELPDHTCERLTFSAKAVDMNTVVAVTWSGLMYTADVVT